jgi:polar amino acid transport system permease protein
MAKKQSWTQNKNTGHLIALVFYIAVGYFFYVAASNMNYVWKWNSVPKYFAYEEITNVEAPIDGKLVLEDGKYFLDGDEKVALPKLDSSFSFEYKVGDNIYQYDYIASKKETKAGPILNGLWVTL